MYRRDLSYNWKLSIKIPSCKQLEGISAIKMERSRCVCLVHFLTIITHCGFETSWICGAGGLTSILPLAINASLEYLVCKNNNISSILQSDFNGKSRHLYYADLSKNKISFIEKGCFKGTNLSRIEVADNFLLSFPDFSEIRATLKRIDVDRNRISSILAEEIDFLSALTYLDLEGNPITYIPDLTQLLPMVNTLDMTYMRFPCCSTMAWLKDLN